MIKIIQYGTKQIKVCGTCGCKFTFDKEDVKRKGIDNYEKFVECPQCKEKITLQTVR